MGINDRLVYVFFSELPFLKSYHLMIGKVIGNETTFNFLIFASELNSFGSVGRSSLLSLTKVAADIMGLFYLKLYSPLDEGYHLSNLFRKWKKEYDLGYLCLQLR